MIFRYQVEQKAEGWLNNALKTQPNALAYLKSPDRWKIFIDLLHTRCNEIDMWATARNKKLSHNQMYSFIERSTKYYGLKWLGEAEKRYNQSSDNV